MARRSICSWVGFARSCAMSNDQVRVRCLRRNIRMLEISSNVRDSVTANRSLHPCVKYLDSSSPQATAMLHLRSVHNVVRLTSRIGSGHRDSPTIRTSQVDTSHTNNVSMPGSPDALTRPIWTYAGSFRWVEDSTPWRISTMIDLEVWNALSSSGVHSNWHIGLRNGLNGALLLRSCA